MVLSVSVYCRHGVIVFTGQDELDESLDSFVQNKTTKFVRDLLLKCDNRKVAFDNNGDQQKQEAQLRDLIQNVSSISNIYRKESCSDLVLKCGKQIWQTFRRNKRLVLLVIAIIIVLVIMYLLMDPAFQETLGNENHKADIRDLTDKRLNLSAKEISNNISENEKELRKKMLK